MSQPQPPFHDLEFPSRKPLWTEGDASTRRLFLMPVSPPSEFVAFGAQGTPERVAFVARGKVREHLGEFIAGMKREGARVELYARAPVQGWLLKQYTSDPPYEGHEYEDPREPPVLGLAPGSQVETYERSRAASLWTVGDASTRRVLLLPVNEPSRFLALGVLGTEGPVQFARTGSVEEDLGDFIAQMVREQARVELYARSPLPEPLLAPYLAHPPGASPRHESRP